MMSMKIQKYVRVLSLVVLLISLISVNQSAQASTNSIDQLDMRIINRNLPEFQDILQDQPTVSTAVNPSSVNIGEAARVTVSLNNVPAEGYNGVELTCSYDPNLVEASNIVVASLFGVDPATAINGPQGGRFIVAIAGSYGNKATNSGTVIVFYVRGLQAGQTTLKCTARVSQGNDELINIQPIPTSISVLGDPLTPTIPPAPCDKAEFIADINVPPGTVMAPSATFIKTWRLTNVGSCTWTTTYQLVFFSGEQMRAVASAVFPRNVAPGQTVDLSLNMTAPSVPGHYRGYWMFKNANGALFGVGPQANEPWFVDIVVSGATPTPTIAPAPCDKAEFIADINIPPGTVMSPGTQFTKTWRLKNSGTCTWTPSYRIAFFSGEQMSALSSVQFPGNIAPGQVVDLSLNMIAPSAVGNYRGYWIFQNSTGGLFGIGPLGNDPWFVDIVVSGATATPTIVPAPCDKAEFIADINVPPGTVMAPDAEFIKTWRLKNVGSCTWTTSYRVQFLAGEQMNAPSSMRLPVNVAPGETFDISLYMTAPSTMGSHRGYWILYNNTGKEFGIGLQGNQSWFVDIVVSNATPSPTPSVTPGGPTDSPTPTLTSAPTATPRSGTYFDFVAQAYTATWSNAEGQLPYPGLDGDPNGFAFKVDNPRLETGAVDTRPGLLMVPQRMAPQNAFNLYIQGSYPPIHVQRGDRFQSMVGCEGGATNCYVGFRLDYQVDGEYPYYPRVFWGPFLERYDGQTSLVNIDLSPLAGKDVKFILTVFADGAATGDRALWVAPIIYRPNPAWTPTPAATPAADWLTFTNRRYSFEFKYPPSGPIIAANDTFATIHLPFVQGTVLQDKSLYVSALENANTCMGGYPLPQSSENVTINGIPFLKQTGQDRGTTYLFRWTSYSTPRNNVCVSLNFILYSLNPGPPATPPMAYDEAAESAIFEQIVATYRWLELTPTITPKGPPTNTPTPTGTLIPTTGTITGQVLAGKQVNISLFDTNQRLVISVDANSDGTYSITAPAGGTYTVIAGAPGHLSARDYATITTNTTITMPTINLLPGDIDDNDVIDQFDALTIGMNYNAATPAAADLNNDGTINVLDLELLAHNYRSTGPTVWQ